MTTINEWLLHNELTLKESGIVSARLDCILLLEDELGKTREWILAHSEDRILESHLLELNTKITQRAQRTPLAYIRNTQEFYGRSFYVDESVLIPRPESESMINLLQKYNQKNPATIVDVGTGSGCLSITTKLQMPGANVIATDISKNALAVAKQNAERFGADVQFLQSNLLANAPNILDTNPYTLLANLPYVPTGFITSPEITKEPPTALFSGDDGLDLYRRLWHQIKYLQRKPTVVITESLQSQHQILIELAESAGYKIDEIEVLCQRFYLIIS